MDPWSVLPALAAIALVFVVAPVGLATFTHWRRPFRLTCPRAEVEAQIRVDAGRTAIADVLGRGTTELEACSLWPAHGGCRAECLALPPGALRAVRRGEPPPRGRRASAIETILVALDGSHASEDAIAGIADVARRHRARVHFLQVAKPPETMRAADGRIVAFAHDESDRLEQAMHVRLKRLETGLPGVRVDGSVRFGDPVKEIVREAELVGADLIAMTHERPGVVRRLTGRSVARRLGHETTIPLLLVPSGQPRTT
ncbi:MAG: universal stress protein [Candidatus Rokubacteria bacterium]|nr:universal stress protein [Candidatus Rokubacteria bacterium]